MSKHENSVKLRQFCKYVSKFIYPRPLNDFRAMNSTHHRKKSQRLFRFEACVLLTRTLVRILIDQYMKRSMQGWTENTLETL